MLHKAFETSVFFCGVEEDKNVKCDWLQIVCYDLTIHVSLCPVDSGEGLSWEDTEDPVLKCTVISFAKKYVYFGQQTAGFCRNSGLYKNACLVNEMVNEI